MPDLDEHLREFLDAERKSRREGVTLANVMIEVQAGRIDVQELGARMTSAELRISRHGRHIRDVQRHLGLLDGGADVDTGQHQIDEIKAKIAEEEKYRRESGIWWRRQTWLWVAAAIGALALVGVSGCATYMLTHVTIQTK